MALSTEAMLNQVFNNALQVKANEPTFTVHSESLLGTDGTAIPVMTNVRPSKELLETPIEFGIPLRAPHELAANSKQELGKLCLEAGLKIGNHPRRAAYYAHQTMQHEARHDAVYSALGMQTEYRIGIVQDENGKYDLQPYIRGGGVISLLGYLAANAAPFKDDRSPGDIANINTFGITPTEVRPEVIAYNMRNPNNPIPVPPSDLQSTIGQAAFNVKHSFIDAYVMLGAPFSSTKNEQE